MLAIKAKIVTLKVKKMFFKIMKTHKYGWNWFNETSISQST